MPDLAQLKADLLADGKLFSSLYDDANLRKWFIKKVVTHLQADPDVAAKSKLYLEKARDNVSTRPQLPRPYSPFDAKLHAAVEDLAVRCRYGAMGVHPEVFLDEDRADLLTFVVERRVRTVVQMVYCVNSGSMGQASRDETCFGFPSLISDSKLRPSVMQYWESCQGGGKWPFRLNAAGRAAPDDAISALFFPPKRQNTNDFHQVECQTAADMVLLDSLLSAAQPRQLLQSFADESLEYFAIDHPDGPLRRSASGVAAGRLYLLSTPVSAGPGAKLMVTPPLIESVSELSLRGSDGVTEDVAITNQESPAAPPHLVRTAAAPLAASRLTTEELGADYARGTHVLPADTGGLITAPYHFLSDARPERALFEQGFVKLDDLQPGDVVHVLGHPLTRAKVPTSGFGGERSVVCHAGKPLTYLIKVSGHGVGLRSILALSRSMLVESNSLLSVARGALAHALNPILTLVPIRTGTIPNPDPADESAENLVASVIERVGRALNFSQEAWSSPGFLSGSFEIYNLPEVKQEELPWWQFEFTPKGYAKHWLISFQGTLTHAGPNGQPVSRPVPAGTLFVFGYWPSAVSTNGFWWPAAGVPVDPDNNYVALIPKRDAALPIDKTLFGIPYWDDLGWRRSRDAAVRHHYAERRGDTRCAHL
ncbi:MAG: hypothetical protein QM756_14330 [Polyangiaceae bacterium]